MSFQDKGGAGGSNDRDIGEGSDDSEDVVPSLMTWLGGIALLTFALFLSARMGIFQECLYARYGKHPWEALFYIVSEPLLHLIVTSGWVSVYWQCCERQLPPMGGHELSSVVSHHLIRL